MAKDIIILAAGVGSRLRPLTNNAPKTMTMVGGKTIIERLLMQINSVDAECNIYLVSGYLGNVLEEHVESLGIPVFFINNSIYDRSNNMYSLWLALEKANPKHDLVIINADCVYDDDIVESVLRSVTSQVAVDKSIYNEESMKVKVDDGGFVRNISKNICKANNVYVSIDIYTLTSNERQKLGEIISEIINGGDINSWTEVALDKLCSSDYSDISILDITGKKWIEIDNHSDLKSAQILFPN